MPDAPTAPTVVWLRDQLVPHAQAVLPVEDRGLQFGESLYEVVPITVGQARMLAPHAARMLRGAELVGIERGAPDQPAWERICAALIEREGVREGLLYAQLTGGTAPRRHVPAFEPEPTFLAYVYPFTFPRAAAVARGVRAITVADTRWARCDVKTTMLLPAVLAKREAARQGAEEAILIGPDGQIREGGSSNLFIVEHGGLVTPPQTRHVLPGITRPFVAEVAGEAGVEVNDGSIDRDRLLAADEVFVTSTSSLAMPILAIDGSRIGTGAAGPIATDLASRLRKRLELE